MNSGEALERERDELFGGAVEQDDTADNDEDKDKDEEEEG